MLIQPIPKALKLWHRSLFIPMIYLTTVTIVFILFAYSCLSSKFFLFFSFVQTCTNIVYLFIFPSCVYIHSSISSILLAGYFCMFCFFLNFIYYSKVKQNKHWKYIFLSNYMINITSKVNEYMEILFFFKMINNTPNDWIKKIEANYSESA